MSSRPSLPLLLSFHVSTCCSLCSRLQWHQEPFISATCEVSSFLFSKKKRLSRHPATHVERLFSAAKWRSPCPMPGAFGTCLYDAANPLQSTRPDYRHRTDNYRMESCSWHLFSFFSSFDVRLITPPFHSGSLTAHSFLIRRIGSWRALVLHLVRLSDNYFSSIRSSRTGVFGLCSSSWWITCRCWSTKTISASLSRRKAVSCASYSKASDPFCVVPTGHVSQNPTDVSPLDSGVLSSANHPCWARVASSLKLQCTAS